MNFSLPHSRGYICSKWDRKLSLSLFFQKCAAPWGRSALLSLDLLRNQSSGFPKFRSGCQCNRSRATQTRLEFYYLSIFDRSAKCIIQEHLVARLSVSDTVCMTDLPPPRRSQPQTSVNSHRLSAGTETLGWNLEQIIPELVFDMMRWPPRKRCRQEVGLSLTKCIGFRLLEFEFPSSKVQFYFL